MVSGGGSGVDASPARSSRTRTDDGADNAEPGDAAVLLQGGAGGSPPQAAGTAARAAGMPPLPPARRRLLSTKARDLRAEQQLKEQFLQAIGTPLSPAGASGKKRKTPATATDPPAKLQRLP